MTASAEIFPRFFNEYTDKQSSGHDGGSESPLCPEITNETKSLHAADPVIWDEIPYEVNSFADIPVLPEYETVSSSKEPLPETDDIEPLSADNDFARVLRRDPTEQWITGNQIILDTVEIMRDDLRDKGMTDGPEMEAIVMRERALMQEELSRMIDGDFSHPYQPPDFSEHLHRDPSDTSVK